MALIFVDTYLISDQSQILLSCLYETCCVGETSLFELPRWAPTDVDFYVRGLLRTRLNSWRTSSGEIAYFDEKISRACAMDIYRPTNHGVVSGYRLIFLARGLTQSSLALLCASAIYEDPQDTGDAPRSLTTSVWETQMK
jgi:hypothetical protein